MIHNVIPINYAGGLGGQFLGSFLYSASKNISIDWVFSKEGNAHETEKTWGSPPNGIGQDITGRKNVDHLINFSSTIPQDETVFVHGHWADPDLLLQHFNKQIKIYYEPKQLNEVIGVFILKSAKQTLFFQQYIIDKDMYENHYVVKWRKQVVNNIHRLVNSCPDLEPRMLNVSWDDMLYNDPEILISKLHNFTSIPKENFNREKFSEWRQLTHKTVDRLRLSGLL